MEIKLSGERENIYLVNTGQQISYLGQFTKTSFFWVESMCFVQISYRIGGPPFLTLSIFQGSLGLFQDPDAFPLEMAGNYLRISPTKLVAGTRPRGLSSLPFYSSLGDIDHSEWPILSG